MGSPPSLNWLYLKKDHDILRDVYKLSPQKLRDLRDVYKLILIPTPTPKQINYYDNR